MPVNYHSIRNIGFNADLEYISRTTFSDGFVLYSIEGDWMVSSIQNGRPIPVTLKCSGEFPSHRKTFVEDGEGHSICWGGIEIL